MDYYKDYTYQMRKFAYTSPIHISLRRVAPKLLQIVRSLTEVKYEDGSYHTYYGEVKRIMSGFLTFYYIAIDDIIKEADRLNHLATKDDLIELIDKTINNHTSNLANFIADYNPTDELEVSHVEEIKTLYTKFMKKVYELKKRIEKIKESDIDAVRKFTKEHFEKSIYVAGSQCEFAYSYYSMMLVDDIAKTRGSLAEIHIRISHNFYQLLDESKETRLSLYDQLYNMNKVKMIASRTIVPTGLEVAEARRAIEGLKAKIENFDKNSHMIQMDRVEDEMAYWEKRQEDFNMVAGNIKRVQDEIEKENSQGGFDKLIKKLYESTASRMRNQTAQNLGRKEYLMQKYERESRGLLTFYACRGLDRIIYQDNTGKYYLDEYNHQCYVQDYGLQDYHISCFKTLTKIPETKYYFDKHGRYIYQAGRQLYQVAPCTSLYDLGTDGLLTKCSDPRELGMTEKDFKIMQCRRKVKDPNDVTILPDIGQLDIKNTMSKENASYLWDTFGSILPHALRDVAVSKSRNPIHYLAHRILYHRYHCSKEEVHERQVEAKSFKEDILKGRIQKDKLRSQVWKSKQVKPRKPEESDDAQERATFGLVTAQREFINALNFDN